MGRAAAGAATLLAIKGNKGTKPLVFLRMMNKKSERGSQKAAAAEAANLSETTGPSGIKPSGTLRICLELREEDNELKIAGLSIVEAEENEDAKFARLLQEEYWKSMKQKKNSGFVMVHNRYLRVKARSSSSCYLGAFKLNHPEASVFINNCNVISRAVMEKCADADDCISTTDAAELAASLDEKVKNDLPLPGQVDFINGGPSQHVCF